MNVMDLAKLQRRILVSAGVLYSCSMDTFSDFVLALDTLYNTSEIRVLLTGSLGVFGLAMLLFNDVFYTLFVVFDQTTPCELFHSIVPDVMSHWYRHHSIF